MGEGAPRLGSMALRVFGVLLLVGVGWSCSGSQQDSQTAEGYTLQKKTAPYCPDGRRDKGCLFGTNCYLTGAGCKVCQCEGLDD